jgi:uncharacterized protein YabE (DUF348 family)
VKPILRRLQPLLLCACGIFLAAAYFLQPVTVFADREAIELRGAYFTAADALRAAGMSLSAQDRLNPAPDDWIPGDGSVRLVRAHTVSLWTGGTQTSFETTERIPANWLARAGLALYPGDQVWLNGRPIDPAQVVSGSGPFALQFQPAAPLRVSIDGEMYVIYSSAPTVGEALWQNGLVLHPGDRLSPPLETRLQAGLAVELRRARAVTIQTGGEEVRVNTAASTVGAALVEAGLTPQGLDTTLPAENEAIPPDGRIQLLRIRETVALAQELLPYQNSFTTTPDLELDQRQVIQPGRYGVVLSRERVRYQDGVEVARINEEKWTAAEPQDQVTGMGTKAVVMTLDTEVGTIEYYRAVTMYATSYSPCQQGMGRCSRATASGIPLEKGVVGVTLAWYRLFAGARVYVPGYGIGIIGDNGGGIPGKYLIDLGYSDEDYVAWHQNVTVYFLTPIPPNIPAILP